MQLPNLIKSYYLTLPSSKSKITYRPFTVLEEKEILMVESDTRDDERNLRIKNVVDACTGGKLDFDKLSPAEIHYIFLNIRAKSVGEKASMFVACERCYDMYKFYEEEFATKGVELQRDPVYMVDVNLRNQYYEMQNKVQKQVKRVHNEVLVDITKLELIVDKDHSSRIQLNETVFVDMSYGVNELIIDEELDVHETWIKTIASCIKVIYDADSVYDNIPMEDKVEWLTNNVTTDVMTETFIKFFETSPTLEYKVDHKCKSCGHGIEKTVTDLTDFF